MYKTRNDGLTKEPTNEKNELHNKWKRFTWTFKLDNNKMEIWKTISWMDATRNCISIHNQIQNVAVEYIANQITFETHQLYKQTTTYNFFKWKWKKKKYYHSPQKGPLIKEKIIRNTNTQYISKTSDYVKPFSKRIPLNNDVEYNKKNLAKIVIVIILFVHFIWILFHTKSNIKLNHILINFLQPFHLLNFIVKNSQPYNPWMPIP